MTRPSHQQQLMLEGQQLAPLEQSLERTRQQEQSYKATAQQHEWAVSHHQGQAQYFSQQREQQLEQVEEMERQVGRVRARVEFLHEQIAAEAEATAQAEVGQAEQARAVTTVVEHPGRHIMRLARWGRLPVGTRQQELPSRP
jgi:chromosome segregation ATPase